MYHNANTLNVPNGWTDICSIELEAGVYAVNFRVWNNSGIYIEYGCSVDGELFSYSNEAVDYAYRVGSSFFKEITTKSIFTVYCNHYKVEEGSTVEVTGVLNIVRIK